MRSVVGAAVLAGIVWAAVPCAAVARRRTLDQEALEAMREPVIPAPRKAPDDLPARPPRRRERPRPPAPLQRRTGT